MRQDAAAMQTGTAPVNGVRLHYRTVGKGEPALLLHGFPETGRAWHKVAAVLGASHRLIIPDLRGMGDSQIEAPTYAKQALAEDVYQLMRSLGHERFFVAGHDWGGSVAFALAHARPQAVRRLACVECIPAGLLPADDLQRTVARQLGGRAWFSSFHMVPDLPETLVAGRERAYLTYLYDAFTVRKGALGPAERDEYVRAYSKPGAMRAAFEFYRAGAEDARDNAPALKKKLPMPVLAVGADGCFVDTTYRAMRVAARDVRGVVYKNCGHFVPEEDPERLARDLAGFWGDGRA